MNKTTLEQWRMLKAVVEHGGFAQAAEAVHKSQSTINHAVHKLQDRLDLPLLELKGRKAHLTEAGKLMLRRAEQLLDQAAQLEDVAASLAAGSAGHDGSVRFGLYLQQVVQHERLATGLLRDRRSDCGCDRQDGQHDAVVHASSGPACRDSGSGTRQLGTRRGDA